MVQHIKSWKDFWRQKIFESPDLMRFIKLQDLWPIGNRLIIKIKPVEEKTGCKLSQKRRCVNASARGQEMKAPFNNNLPTQTKGVMVKQWNPATPEICESN